MMVVIKMIHCYSYPWKENVINLQFSQNKYLLQVPTSSCKLCFASSIIWTKILKLLLVIDIKLCFFVKKIIKFYIWPFNFSEIFEIAANCLSLKTSCQYFNFFDVPTFHFWICHFLTFKVCNFVAIHFLIFYIGWHFEYFVLSWQHCTILQFFVVI